MSTRIVAYDDGVADRVAIDEDGTDNHCVFTLRAIDDLSDLATDRYSRPSVAIELTPMDLLGSAAQHVELLGFAFTQFAMPVLADEQLDFDFHPVPNLRSPRAMLPLIVRGGGRAALLAPVAGAHEQIISARDGQLLWGWHGDLDEIEHGHSTSVHLYRGASVAELLDRWRVDLAPVEHRPIDDNPALGNLAYWTDNGAAYWYRTENGRSIGESVVDVVNDLRASNVPVTGVELDSWFYPHERPRQITEIAYPDDVPPTGAMTWTPRDDAFPGVADGDGVGWLAEKLGHPPLILHARHISPSSPYITNVDEWWVDEFAAAPVDPQFFRRWFEDARRWGTTCIEQDWMQVFWFAVRELRRHPGRAAQWQRTLNRLAAEYDVDLLWCMATPADMIEASQLDRVAAIRTSDDYRFTTDPALLWTWFLTVNRLAEPLGLAPFKDCFFSNPKIADDDDAIDGDRHAEVEALLSALGAGPVGIGDRIGCTDREIVMRTCDDAGRLLRPDRPIALIDDCLFGAPARGDRLAWASTDITVEGRTWTYVVALNTAQTSVDDTLTLAEIGVTEPRYLYDWRTGEGSIGAEIPARLMPRDWSLFVCCPLGGATATVGDPTKYATMAAAPERWERRTLRS
ncbi:MAG: hypothetical protein AAGF73_04210 [Actinomycetota bacterium]